MNKSMLLRGYVVLMAIIVLTTLAYGFSFKVTSMYDERMHRDVQGVIQTLTATGMPQAQIGAIRSVLLDVNRNTIGYMTSEIFNLIGTISVLGIIVMSFALALVRKPEEKG